MAGDRDGSDDDDGVTRADFEAGVRFVADAAMRTSLAVARIEALLKSTVRTLVEMRTLDLEVFERKLAAATTPKPSGAPAREPPPVTIRLGKSIDKHAAPSPADLDCAALLPLCGARCCMLTFALTESDLAEGRLAWSYRAPYHIAHGADHRCVHQDRPTGGCTVYADRPAVCRTYDCRTDSRVWEDFERRIPAPLDAVRGAAPDRER